MGFSEFKRQHLGSTFENSYGDFTLYTTYVTISSFNSNQLMELYFFPILRYVVPVIRQCYYAKLCTTSNWPFT